MRSAAINLLRFAVFGLLFSSTVSAAKPTSIKYIEDIVLNNSLIYSHYVVNCSDGRTVSISAWDNQSKWCKGKGKLDDCSKKQLTTAKKVCQ